MIYLILLFTILFFILAWRRLDWAVMLLIAGLPAYLIRFNIFGLPSTLLEAMIWIVFIVWFLRNYKHIFEDFKFKIRHSLKIRNWKLEINNRYPFDWEIILLLLVAWTAAGAAGFSASSLGAWKAYFFEPVLLFIVAINLMAKKFTLSSFVKGVELVLRPLAISALAVSLLAIYQKVTGQLIDNPVWAAEGTRRVVSFFGYPNAVGLYLGPLILVFIGWLVSVISKSSLFLSSSGGRQRDPWIHTSEAKNNLDCSSVLTSAQKKKAGCRRGNDKGGMAFQNDKIKIIFIILTIILSWFSIYFAKSKGALLGVAAGLVVFGLMASKKIRWAMVVIVLIMAGCVLSYQPARKVALDTITFKSLSGQIRMAGWSDAWQMLKDGRFLTGAGLANYQAAVAPYHTEGIFIKDFSDPEAQRKLVFNAAYRAAHWQPLEIYLYPHNIILNFWSELGLAGLILFVWIIGKYVYLGIFNFLRQPADSIFNQIQNPKSKIKNLSWCGEKYLIIGLICSMVVIVVHGLVDAPYFKNDLAAMFWLFLAMMGIISLKDQREIERNKAEVKLPKGNLTAE